MAWSSRTVYAVAKGDLTVLVGSGGAPTEAITSTRGIAIRTDGSVGSVVYETEDSGTTWTARAAPFAPSNPADAAAVPVTHSATIALTIAAGVETNTLAAPAWRGQVIDIYADTVGGGSRAITSAVPVNQAGNTIMTFAAVADYVRLVGIYVSGALRWAVAANDGVALS